jgi:hypothetical protein
MRPDRMESTDAPEGRLRAATGTGRNGWGCADRSGTVSFEFEPV